MVKASSPSKRKAETEQDSPKRTKMANKVQSSSKVGTEGHGITNKVEKVPLTSGPLIYLTMENARDAISFYERAFGAELSYSLDMPDGKIAHAEIKIGHYVFMLSDTFPGMNTKTPKDLGGSPVSLVFYTENVDKLAERAMKAGLIEIEAIKDQFYGDRNGTFKDPFGYFWMIATHIEDVSPDDMRKRMASWDANSN